LNNTLSNLKTPATLFLPTNEALDADMTAHNFTNAYDLTLPYFNSALEYYIAPDQAIMVSCAMQGKCFLTRKLYHLHSYQLEGIHLHMTCKCCRQDSCASYACDTLARLLFFAELQ